MDVSERRVCIVCQGINGDSIIEYMVFVIDLAEVAGEIRIPTIPTVRVDAAGLFEAAFVVMDSQLFVFDGFHLQINPGGGKSMLRYELHDGVSNLRLDRSMLSKGPTMNGVKACPSAAVTPHGKILVFSSRINICWPNEYDFELYDPENGEWQKLPLLSPLWVEDKNYFFWVLSFTFMKNNDLLVRTELGTFALDITRKIWKPHSFPGSGAIPPHPGISFSIIGKEICVIPYGAFDIRPCKPNAKDDLFANLYYTFPELSSICDYDCASGGVVLLGDYGVKTPNEVIVCFLHSGLNEETKPELLLQMYRCHLRECKKKLQEYRQKKIEEHPNWMERTREGYVLPGSEKIGSMTLVVEEATPSFSFNLCSFASIPFFPIPCRRITPKQSLLSQSYLSPPL